MSNETRSQELQNHFLAQATYNVFMQILNSYKKIMYSTAVNCQCQSYVITFQTNEKELPLLHTSVKMMSLLNTNAKNLSLLHTSAKILSLFSH